MRKFSLIFCLLIGFQLSAQEDFKPWSLNLGVGTTYRFPNTFGPELNSLLTSRSTFPQIATNVTLGVNYNVTDLLSLGLYTWGVFFPKVETSVTKVTLTGLGAGLKGSYNVIEAGEFSSDIYLGFGIYHTASNISNDGFLVNRAPLFIPPGNTQFISGQAAFLDVGIQLWKYTSDVFGFGLSGGYIAKLTGSDWKTSWGESIDALTPPTLSLLYLRLSVTLKSR